MTVAQAIPLQQAVFTIVSAAAVGVPVYDHAPGGNQIEYIRLDGFGIADQSPKNAEQARHAFEVHHFIAGSPGATLGRGQKRTKELLATVHAALMAAQILGEKLDHEYLDIFPDVNGATVHGMSRYSVVLK